MKIQDIIDFLFLLVGERFKGLHIKILSVLNVLTGTIAFFNTEIVTFLCETWNYCISIDNKYMILITTINSYLVYIARKFVTTKEANLLSLPKRLSGQYKEEVNKLKLK